MSALTTRGAKAIRSKISQINSQEFVFFTRGDNIANLNQVMLYVLNNEHTSRGYWRFHTYNEHPKNFHRGFAPCFLS